MRLAKGRERGRRKEREPEMGKGWVAWCSTPLMCSGGRVRVSGGSVVESPATRSKATVAKRAEEERKRGVDLEWNAKGCRANTARTCPRGDSGVECRRSCRVETKCDCVQASHNSSTTRTPRNCWGTRPIPCVGKESALCRRAPPPSPSSMRLIFKLQALAHALCGPLFRSTSPSFTCWLFFVLFAHRRLDRTGRTTALSSFRRAVVAWHGFHESTRRRQQAMHRHVRTSRARRAQAPRRRSATSTPQRRTRGRGTATSWQGSSHLPLPPLQLETSETPHAARVPSQRRRALHASHPQRPPTDTRTYGCLGTGADAQG